METKIESFVPSSSCLNEVDVSISFPYSCAESNLNGIYHDEPLGQQSRKYKGIFWEHWLGDYSLKASKMMIRPKDVWYSQPLDDDLIEIQNEDLMLTGRHSQKK